MVARKKTWADDAVVDRAALVERTVQELCELLRAGAPYPEISGRIDLARGALQSIPHVLWQRELVRTVGDPRRGAA